MKKAVLAAIGITLAFLCVQWIPSLLQAGADSAGLAPAPSEIGEAPAEAPRQPGADRREAAAVARKDEVDETATLIGRVVDGASARPLAGCKVRLLPAIQSDTTLLVARCPMWDDGLGLDDSATLTMDGLWETGRST